MVTGIPNRTEPVSRARYDSAWFGVFLVVLGIAFLAARFITGVTWWQLWPLAFVVVGLLQAFTPNHRGEWGLDRLVDGLGTVVFGAALLGNTTGVIPWSMWFTALSLWPVLLIAAGLGLLGKATRQGWVGMFGPVMIWAVVAYSAAVAWSGGYVLPAGIDLHITL